jgi:hypothetical protein
MKNIIFLILLSCFGLYQAHAGRLELTCKPKDDKGNVLKNAWAVVYLDGKKIDYIAMNANGELFIKLELDKVYTIDIEELNYEKTTISVDTKVPAGKKGFIYTYVTGFELVRKKSGFVPEYVDDPVMYISFNPAKDEFKLKSSVLPQYNYVPAKTKENPETNNTKEKPEVIADKPPTNVKDTAPAVTNDKPIVTDNKLPADNLIPDDKLKDKMDEDRFVERQGLNADNKGVIEQMEKEKELEKQAELESVIVRSGRKRIFLEEIADSKRTMKKKANNYSEK